jgi:hypothetical protein
MQHERASIFTKPHPKGRTAPKAVEPVCFPGGGHGCGRCELGWVAAQVQAGEHAEFLAPATMAWVFKNMLLATSMERLQSLHILSYYIHDITFFSFLCFLPMGKHFHVITSLFNVYFMRLEKGKVRPVRYGVSDDQLDSLESFGVKKFSDFTWKDILDFYSCADCGRCSINAR